MKQNEIDDEPFDCVQAKRRAQAQIYETIKDLSAREQIAYFNRSAEEGPFGPWLQRVRAHRLQVEAEQRKTS